MKRALFSVLIVLGLATTARASNDLAIGGGVSSPAAMDAPADNPAGLILNPGVRIEGALDSANSKFDPTTATGRLVYGNGGLAVLAGTHTYKDGTENRYNLDYGLGVMAESLATAIGVSVSSRLQKTPAVPGPKTDVNVGLLTSPGSATHVGLGFVSMVGGTKYINTGVSTALGSDSTFALDASSDRQFKGTTLMPALGVRLGGFETSVGYGWRIKKESEDYFKTGWNFGVNMILGKNISVRGEYNHHTQYDVALVASF